MKTLLLSAAAAVLLVAGAVQAQTPVGPLPPFSSVELRHGGRVVLREGPQQSVTLLQGSLAYTDIKVRRDNGLQRSGKLVIEACARKCPNRYDLTVLVTAPRLKAVAVDEGGEIRAEGAFNRRGSLAAAVDGGGSIDIRAIPAANVAAAIDGGGRILTAPRTSLAVAIDGGGEVLYTGDPALVTAIDGGGKVRRISDVAR